jgi:hypothetical protein
MFFSYGESRLIKEITFIFPILLFLTWSLATNRNNWIRVVHCLISAGDHLYYLIIQTLHSLKVGKVALKWTLCGRKVWFTSQRVEENVSIYVSFSQKFCNRGSLQRRSAHTRTTFIKIYPHTKVHAIE